MYKIIGKDTQYQAVFKENEDGSVTSFPFDPFNTDYQQYLAWCEAGNTPEPAEEQQ